MSTIAIIGAGPGMGMAIARVFGAQGFDIALIARNGAKLDDLARQLGTEGITAKGFPADVLDHAQLGSALEDAAAHFDDIDVLEYSPADAANIAITTPSQSTPADIQVHIDEQLYGAIAATRAVLPAMREAGSGTLLFTTGAGSVDPNPMLGNINPGQAALRNWALNLHKELADTGVQAAHVAIGVWIGAEAPEGVPTATPDQIATLYWDLHVNRDDAERIFTA